MKSIPYIGIILLLLVILLQNRGCIDQKEQYNTPPKIDTMVVYKYIHDTIPGKPVYLKTKIDTSVWMKRSDNIPDTTYKGLLSQYKGLGNKYFSTNIFKTDFKIAEYGSITLTDSVRENQLVSSVLTTNLNIPVTTITIEKSSPPKRQLFVGGSFVMNKTDVISGVYGGLQLKTKRDRLYGISVGWAGKPQLAGSLYYPIKQK